VKRKKGREETERKIKCVRRRGKGVERQETDMKGGMKKQEEQKEDFKSEVRI